jgi:hypothetical protein
MKTKLHLSFLSSVLILQLTFGEKANAQVIYTESFNTFPFPPTGWTLTAVPGQPIWSRVTNGTNPTTLPLTGAAMARFQSNNAPAASTQTLITPLVDYSAITVNDTARISLWIFRDTGDTTLVDSLSIWVNTAASLTGATHIGAVARPVSYPLPVTELANGWYRYTFDVPASFSTATNYLLIQGTSQLGNNIFVDDVSWNAFPPLCSGVPSGGTITANPSLLCGGGGTSSLNVSGAFTSLAGISYQWQSAPASTGPWTNFGGSTATVTSTITSTTYYRCVISCSYSSMADSSTLDSVMVNTNPLPTVLGNPVASNYCNGSNVPVMLTASGAVTYTWAPATGLDTTIGDTVYSIPNATTTYVLTGFDSTGCSDTAHVTVTLRQPPNVNMNQTTDSICLGDSATIQAQAFGGGLTYLWQPDGQTTQTIQVSPAASTTYIVTVTNPFGCATVDSAFVNVIPDPVANFGFTVNGRTVIFSDSSLNSTSWYWIFGDGNESHSQNPLYTYSFDSTFSVTLIVTGTPCGTDTITFQVTISTVGIPELTAENNFLVYPNPFSSSSQLIFALDKTEFISVKLYDMLGKEVRNIAERKFAPGNNLLTIERNEIEGGTYFIRIVADEFTAVKKITVE